MDRPRRVAWMAQDILEWSVLVCTQVTLHWSSTTSSMMNGSSHVWTLTRGAAAGKHQMVIAWATQNSIRSTQLHNDANQPSTGTRFELMPLLVMRLVHQHHCTSHWVRSADALESIPTASHYASDELIILLHPDIVWINLCSSPSLSAEHFPHHK